MKPCFLLLGLCIFAAGCATDAPQTTKSCRGPACSPTGSERGNAVLSCEGWWCPDGTIETSVEATSSDTAEDHDAEVEEPVAQWSLGDGNSNASQTEAAIDTAEDHGVAPQSNAVEESPAEEPASPEASASADSTDSAKEPKKEKSRKGWPKLIYEIPTRERE